MRYNVLFAFNWVTVIVPVVTEETDEEIIAEEATEIAGQDGFDLGRANSIEIDVM